MILCTYHTDPANPRTRCCRLLDNGLSQDVLEQIVSEAVAIEREFICESLPAALIGMNDALMAEYIEFAADRLLVELKSPKLFNTKNPFNWMEQISLQCVSLSCIGCVFLSAVFPCRLSFPVSCLFLLTVPS